MAGCLDVGLDAYVPCRCWLDGLAEAPPFDPALLRVTEWGEVRPDTDDRLLAEQVHAWRKTACAHQDMDLASERISNWSGLRRFRSALASAGEFPVLAALLPDGNHGSVSASESRAALAELARFTALESFGTNVFLADLDTGAEIWSEPVDSYWSTPYTVGYDANGIYVVHRGGRIAVEVFRAMRVEQLPVPDDNGEPDAWTRLTDLDDGTLMVLRARPIRGSGDPPRRMGVVTRTETPADFGYIVEPLTAVFSASVATGNEVIWI